MSDLTTLFSKIGLSDHKVKETIKNASLSANLKTIITDVSC